MRTFDASFTAATATGSVAGAITPVAVLPQVDSVDARLPLDAGGVLQSFIVRTVAAAVATTGETYAIPALPTGAPSRAYTIVGTRRSVDASGADTLVTSPAVNAAVAPAGTVAADLAFPP